MDKARCLTAIQYSSCAQPKMQPVFLSIMMIASITQAFKLPSNKEQEMIPRIQQEMAKSIDQSPVPSAAAVENDDAFKLDTMINKAAVRDGKRLWPNGQVPYIIDKSYSKNQRRSILRAMDEFHRHTCIRFVPRSNESNFIDIKKTNRGCYSFIGMKPRGQEVSLDDGCLIGTTPTIHELMHAIGFAHEQTRTDRNQFVNVLFENIDPKLKHNYAIGSQKEFQILTPYDYDSVMHYKHDAFALSGKSAMSRRNGSTRLGNNRGFSILDIIKINKLYKCE